MTCIYCPWCGGVSETEPLTFGGIWPGAGTPVVCPACEGTWWIAIEYKEFWEKAAGTEALKALEVYDE